MSGWTVNTGSMGLGAGLEAVVSNFWSRSFIQILKLFSMQDCATLTRTMVRVTHDLVVGGVRVCTWSAGVWAVCVWGCGWDVWGVYEWGVCEGYVGVGGVSAWGCECGCFHLNGKFYFLSQNLFNPGSIIVTRLPKAITTHSLDLHCISSESELSLCNDDTGAVKLAQSIRRSLWGERLRVRVPSVPILSWKLSVLEIPLDKELTANGGGVTSDHLFVILVEIFVMPLNKWKNVLCSVWFCHFTPWTWLLKFAHFCPL